MGSRRGSVDLVCQEHLGEYRAGAELEVVGLLIIDVRSGHVGWKKVGGALYAIEGAAQGARYRPGKHRLPDTRHVLDEDVPLAQNRHQRQLHHVGLAHNDPRNIVVNVAGRIGDSLN